MTYFNLAVLWSALAICKSHISSHTTSQCCRQETRSVQHLAGAKQFLSHTTVSNACVGFIMEGCEGNSFDVVGEGKKRKERRGEEEEEMMMMMMI